MQVPLGLGWLAEFQLPFRPGNVVYSGSNFKKTVNKLIYIIYKHRHPVLALLILSCLT